MPCCKSQIGLQNHNIFYMCQGLHSVIPPVNPYIYIYQYKSLLLGWWPSPIIWKYWEFRPYHIYTHVASLTDCGRPTELVEGPSHPILLFVTLVFSWSCRPHLSERPPQQTPMMWVKVCDFRRGLYYFILFSILQLALFGHYCNLLTSLAYKLLLGNTCMLQIDL